MILAYRMGPAASGRRLCDIDRVLFRVTNSRVRKLGSLGTAKLYQYLAFFDFNYNRYIFAVTGLPIF